MGTSADQAGAPRRRAWGSLSRAQIIDAALEIARREGLAALTIRRLAADLGASRMALYRHVADKDALVDLVMDAIAEHDMVPPGVAAGSWPDRLRLLAAGMRRELAAYPGMIDLLMGRTRHGPGALRLMESLLGILADAGLDEGRAARFYVIFTDLVFGRVRWEQQGDPLAEHRRASLHAMTEEEAARYPRIRAAGPHLHTVSPDEVFEAELDMFIQAVRHAADGRGPS